MNDRGVSGNEKPVEYGGGCRGALGEERAEPFDSAPRKTSIDLTKRADLAMVHRAVVNGWDVTDDMREQICEQLPAAIDLAAAESDRGNYRRLFKVAKLMLVMEATNQVLDGVPKKRVRPRLRRRGKEHRQGRRGREAREGAELEKLVKELAARGIVIGPERDSWHSP